MKVMILCASHNDLGLIKALRQMGFYIIATGNIPGLAGEKYVDQYIQADYSDKEMILKLAIEHKIDAICQCCNDFGVYTAAYVAEKLGLPGYDSYETTLLLHNKDKFKHFAQQYQVPSPAANVFSDYEDAMQWITEQTDYSMIVKPVDASAGNGICKITSFEEAKEVIKNAFCKSRAGRIIIEQFITGTQHGFCTFLRNQKVIAYCTNNEYSFVNQYRVEIDTFPSDVDKDIYDLLIKEIEKIADILHLKDGIFHLQYILRDETPQIIEVMRRVLGNMYSVPANMVNAMNWDYWEARAKCGLSCDTFPANVGQEGYYAYKTLLAGKTGVIRAIHEPLQYEKYLQGKFLLKETGDTIMNYQSEPVGFLFFKFSSQEEMRQVLIENYDDTLVEMEE